MAMLIDGKWQDDVRPSGPNGRYVRADSIFRDWITCDGSSGFKAEPGRYHLYVSLACPWAHRTLIFRKLKGLETVLSASISKPLVRDRGWEFGEGPGSTPDMVNGCDALYEVYLKAKPGHTGRVTVPALWDKQEKTIVNNESSEIIRMLNAAFVGVVGNDLDYYPQDLRSEIDAVNKRVYDTVNNGVYRTGFATSQQAYEDGVNALFATFDWLEERLATVRYLVGGRQTEADWRLFTTLVRFDSVYHGHFKCNRRRLVDYPALWAYCRDLYQTPGVAETVNLEHIRIHYYGGQKKINPTGIVAVGPDLDFDAPHGREGLA